MWNTLEHLIQTHFQFLFLIQESKLLGKEFKDALEVYHELAIIITTSEREEGAGEL